MTQSFFADVSRWSDKALRNMELVHRKSTEEVIKTIQTPVGKGGNMPVLDGNLRNSVQISINGGGGTIGEDDYTMLIGMDLGDTVQATWGGPSATGFIVEYARAVEYGAQGRPGRFYVRSGAQKWPGIVASNAAKLKD